MGQNEDVVFALGGRRRRRGKVIVISHIEYERKFLVYRYIYIPLNLVDMF